MATPRRRQLLRTVGAGVALGLTAGAGCLGGGPVAKTQEVELTTDGFDPLNIRIDRQQTAFWENLTDTRYRLLSATSTWNFRQPLQPGKTTGHTFNTSGIYRLVAREAPASDGEGTPTPTPTPGTPEFSGVRMKIAVGEELTDPVTESG